MALLLCVHQLAMQEGVYWVVPNSESAVGAQLPLVRALWGWLTHLYAYTAYTKTAINIVSWCRGCVMLFLLSEGAVVV